MLFIFRLVFSTNKQGYDITTTELWEQMRILGIDLPQPTPVAPSAFCNARAKLDEEVFKILQVKILQQAKPDPDKQWQGHRLLAVDGSTLNLPRQLLRAGYKTPSDNAYYPQGTVSCLYELTSKIPIDFDLSKHSLAGVDRSYAPTDHSRDAQESLWENGKHLNLQKPRHKR